MAEGVTITVRLIRSFEHRNIRPIVLLDVSLDTVTSDFQRLVLDSLKTRSELLPPVRDYDYDTMKIMHKAHGAKSNDPVINTEQDDVLMLKRNGTLRESGIEHETELSFFKMDDYIRYKESILN